MIVIAEPYDARQCPECLKWIFTAAPPYGEDDPTKTLRDWLHWEREHLGPMYNAEDGFPFFTYNTQPVEAVVEDIEEGQYE